MTQSPLHLVPGGESHSRKSSSSAATVLQLLCTPYQQPACQSRGQGRSVPVGIAEWRRQGEVGAGRHRPAYCTCPMSTAGLRLLPQSRRASLRRMRYSPGRHGSSQQAHRSSECPGCLIFLSWWGGSHSAPTAAGQQPVPKQQSHCAAQSRGRGGALASRGRVAPGDGSGAHL